MDRKTFLGVIARYLIFSLLLLTAACYVGAFLLHALTEHGSERWWLVSLSGLGLFLIALRILEVVLGPVVQKSGVWQSPSAKRRYRIVAKIFDYLLPMLFGILISQAWEKDQRTALPLMGVFGIILVRKIREILQEER
ncbi:hypothetical protein SAMN05421823_104544 [Catalinimonas alkaloidigena]|uniref:Uncharacterized protein n=1 Tax=Catalinimonas alkaloidigena TaxID=1075417 RepID=A0A1G9HUE1_9BACT|nr:hypothetical protein [Catalinimonas alkaloidigena]SDL16579.1 hypothetical protein SAMN05421823_104544 [Catalinimonas alkaloidigena]